jgi:hypothetical protein
MRAEAFVVNAIRSLHLDRVHNKKYMNHPEARGRPAWRRRAIHFVDRRCYLVAAWQGLPRHHSSEVAADNLLPAAMPPCA